VNIKTWARHVAAVLVCLWAVTAAAQEAPAPPPPPESPATPPEPESADPGVGIAEEAVPVTEAAPAAESMSAQEDAPPSQDAAVVDTKAPTEPGLAAISGAKRIVVLPVEFTVYEKSVAGLEAVPDWSESAKYALGDAAAKMLKLDNRFEIVAMPTFEDETDSLLREHVELFKIVADSVTSLLTYGGKAWHEKRTNFDYTLGDGLAFVADAAQAEYALIVAGAQVKQTGGAVFMQLLAAAGGYSAPGGGTFVVIGVVNLRSGNVAWFNWKQGVEIFGMTGSDVRDPVAAAELVGKMFAEYPSSKMITFRPF
jgi:hypothetical protein